MRAYKSLVSRRILQRHIDRPAPTGKDQAKNIPFWHAARSRHALRAASNILAHFCLIANSANHGNYSCNRMQQNPLKPLNPLSPITRSGCSKARSTRSGPSPPGSLMTARKFPDTLHLSLSQWWPHVLQQRACTLLSIAVMHVWLAAFVLRSISSHLLIRLSAPAPG